MHATRQLVSQSGPIDVTGTFQVESEAISNAFSFRASVFCAIPHLEIHAEHMEFILRNPHSKSMWTSVSQKKVQHDPGSGGKTFKLRIHSH